MAGNEWDTRYHAFVTRMEQRFPELYGEDLKYTYGGFLIGEGWWPLVEKLSELITVRTNNCGANPVQVKQVRVKNGGLNFIYSGGDDYIKGAVDLVKKISYTVCEECGDDAIDGDPFDSERTLCYDHRQIHGWYKAK